MTEIVTCRTEGCPSDGKAVEGLPLSWVDETTGETVTVGSIACGACSQPITDIEGA